MNTIDHDSPRGLPRCPRAPRAIAPAIAGLLGARGRALLRAQLARLQHGELTLVDGARASRFGRAHRALRAVGHACTCATRASTPTIAFGGSVGAGEAYMDGRLDVRRPDRAGAHPAAQPRRARRHGRRPGAARRRRCASCCTRSRRNTRDGSRRNIAAHYDLGNDFFALFLDRDDDVLVARCSSATTCRSSRRRSPSSTASAASSSCSPAITCSRSAPAGAASRCMRRAHYGCHVTTTTISREQHALARERVARRRPRRSHHAAARRLPRPDAASTTSWCRSR